MNDMEFQPDKTITAMMSGEGEKIKFISKIDPKDKKVEDWMCEVEKLMYISIRDAMKTSIQEYTEMGRNDWILNHPGQCVLNGSQVHWTKDLETHAT